MPASRKYTVDEANRLMPWLTQTFTRIHQGQQALVRAQKELETVARTVRTNGHRDIDRRIQTAGQMVEKRQEELRNLLASIAERDIEVRDVDMGLVDFLGERDGRDVWLCWRLGETEVGHWHELDQGFTARQPL
jgi:hypothetical protein